MKECFKTFLIFVVLLATTLELVKSRVVGRTEFGDQNALREFFQDVVDFETETPETEATRSSENKVKNELPNSERIDPFEFSDLSLFSMSDKDFALSELDQISTSAEYSDEEFEEDDLKVEDVLKVNSKQRLKVPTNVPAKFNKNSRKRAKYDIFDGFSAPNQLPESLRDAKVPEQTSNNKWISKTGTSSDRSTSIDESITHPVDIPSVSRRFEGDPPVMGNRKKLGGFNGPTTSENPVASDDQLSRLIAQVFQENHNGGELEQSSFFGEDSSSPVDVLPTVNEGFESNPPTMDDRRKFGNFNGFTPPENPVPQISRPLFTVIPGANRKEDGNNVDRSSNGGNSFNQDFTDPIDIPSPGSGGFGSNPPTMDDQRKFGDFNGFTPPENSSSEISIPPSTMVPQRNREEDGARVDHSYNRGNPFNQDFTDPIDIPSGGSGGSGRNPPNMDDQRKFGDFNGFTPPENSASQISRPLFTMIPQGNREEDGESVDHSSNRGNPFNPGHTDPVDIPSPGSGGFDRNPPIMDDRRKFGDFNGFTPPESPQNFRPLSTVIPNAHRKEDVDNVDRSNRGNSFNQDFTDPIDIPSPGSGGFGSNPPTMDDQRKFGDFNGFTPPENSASQISRPFSTLISQGNREEDRESVHHSSNRGNPFFQDFTDPVDIPSPGSGGFGRNPPSMDDRRKFGDFNGFTPPENPGVQRNRLTSESGLLSPLSAVIPDENRKQDGQGLDRSINRGNSFNQDFTDPVDIPSPGGDFGRNPTTMNDRRKFGDFNGLTPENSASQISRPLFTMIPQGNREEDGESVDHSSNRDNPFNPGHTNPVDIPSPGSGGFDRNPPIMDDRRKFGDFNGFTPPESPQNFRPLSTVIPNANRKEDVDNVDRSNRGNSFNQDFTDPVDIPSPGSGGFGRNPPIMDDRRKFGNFNGFTLPENPQNFRPLSTVTPNANRNEDVGNVDRSNRGNSFNQDFTDLDDIPSPGNGGFGRNTPTIDDARKFGDFNGFNPAHNVRDGGHTRHVMPPYQSGHFRQPHHVHRPIGGFHSHGYHGNYRTPPFDGHSPLSGPSGHYDYNRMGNVQHIPHQHITPLPQHHPRPHTHYGMHYLPPVNYNRPIPFNGNSYGNFHSSYRG